MFTTLFWLVVIGLAQAIDFGWISSKVQKRSYKRDIRSRHSYVLLAILLAEEENLRCNTCDCREDGTGKVYLGLPQGIVKVFSRFLRHSQIFEHFFVLINTKEAF